MTKRQQGVLKTAGEMLHEMGPVKWLWPGWLPKSGIIQLFAVPGIGKTTLALRLATCVTNGRDWPDGTPGFSESGIVYCFRLE